MPAIVTDVSYREEVRGVEQLTDEEQRLMRTKMEALDKLLQVEGKAKYKIELFFSRARSMHKPTPGIMSFWESGSRIHGGGDLKIYICPGKRLKKNECQSFIPDSGNASAILFCPKCGTSWQGEDVIGEHMGNHSMRIWSEVIFHYFVRLDHNADVYLKHAKDDIRTVAMVEQAAQKGGEVLAKVRDKRAQLIYPLGRIIKDCSAGASPLTRFYALLTA